MASCSGNDTYAQQLTKFLLDYIADLDTVIKLLEDPETTEITQGHMHAICKKSKVSLINTRDASPYDDEIIMDRSYLIGLVKICQKIIAQKPMTLVLQRNDDYITLIG